MNKYIYIHIDICFIHFWVLYLHLASLAKLSETTPRGDWAAAVIIAAYIAEVLPMPSDLQGVEHRRPLVQLGSY